MQVQQMDLFNHVPFGVLPPPCISCVLTLLTRRRCSPGRQSTAINGSQHLGLVPSGLGWKSSHAYPQDLGPWGRQCVLWEIQVPQTVERHRIRQPHRPLQFILVGRTVQSAISVQQPSHAVWSSGKLPCRSPQDIEVMVAHPHVQHNHHVTLKQGAGRGDLRPTAEQAADENARRIREFVRSEFARHVSAYAPRTRCRPAFAAHHDETADRCAVYCVSNTHQLCGRNALLDQEPWGGNSCSFRRWLKLQLVDSSWRAGAQQRTQDDSQQGSGFHRASLRTGAGVYQEEAPFNEHE